MRIEYPERVEVGNRRCFGGFSKESVEPNPDERHSAEARQNRSFMTAPEIGSGARASLRGRRDSGLGDGYSDQTNLAVQAFSAWTLSASAARYWISSETCEYAAA